MQCQARALAQSDEAKARLRAPTELDVAMRKTWVDEADYRRGRSMVWIKRFEVTT
jgi:predicted metal-dependent HD superfamily phosphohydrolase